MAWTIDSDLVKITDEDIVLLNWSGMADASELTDTALFDTSAQTLNTTGGAAASLKVLKIRIACGIVSARLEFDADTDDLIIQCPANTVLVWPTDIFPLANMVASFLTDPKSTGTNGDIVITTLGGAVGGGVSIQLKAQLLG